MKFAPKLAAAAMSVAVIFSLAGCKEKTQAPQAAAQPVTVVTVQISAPVMTTELNGRTSAYQVAEVRPQISSRGLYGCPLLILLLRLRLAHLFQ